MREGGVLHRTSKFSDIGSPASRFLFCFIFFMNCIYVQRAITPRKLSKLTRVNDICISYQCNIKDFWASKYCGDELVG